MSSLDVRSCKICSKPFISPGGKICPECVEQSDRDFVTIRDYLYDHPNENIERVEQDTGVSKKMILYLMKEDRLASKLQVTGAAVCKICGRTISTGAMCDKCASSLTKELGSMSAGQNVAAAKKADEQAKRDRTGPRMHVEHKKFK